MSTPEVHPLLAFPAPTISVRYVPISAIAPAPYNPRRMPEEEMAALVESIRAFGFAEPVVVRRGDMLIVGGHQRVEAARRLGMLEVPVVELDLSDEQAKSLNVALNRIHGEFDIPKLAELLASLPPDLQTLTGFDEAELRRVAHEAEAAVEALRAGVEPDDIPPLPVEPTSRVGDVYRLGPHTLVCGDCRDPKVLEVACGGRPIDCLWSDAPYGVSYVGGTSAALTIKNDNAEGLEGLLRASFAAADAVMAPSARWYLASPAGPQGTVFRLAVASVGWRLHEVLVWVKDSLVLGHSDYHYRHEDVLYGWKPGEGRPGRGNHDGTRWYGDHAQDTVVEIARPRRSEEHPTAKPVELVRRCLLNSTRRGDDVLDPFVGSGTTILACEQLGRVAHAVELDPRYADVAVARWERLTGGKAERVTP